MRTRPDKKWPGKYSRFVLSKSIKNLLSFLVISPPKMRYSSLCIGGEGQFVRARLRHRGFTLTEYTSRNAQEQPSSSMRYLVMRGENHWLASHQQHVRNMARVSLSLSVLRNLSLFLYVLVDWYQLRYHDTPHRHGFLNSGTSHMRSPHFSRSTDDRGKIDRTPIL